MSSKTKTFSCKYCDITGIPRNEYKKHIRTNKHRNMLEYSRHSDKVRTQMSVNEKSSSTQHKFTNDGKYVMDFIKTMKEETKETKEKKYDCKYCVLSNMTRSDFTKHIKLKSHYINVRNERSREQICQSMNIVKHSKGMLKVHRTQKINIDNTTELINKQFGTDLSFNEILCGKGMIKDETTGELKPLIIRM
jgi:hypothetical protein